MIQEAQGFEIDAEQKRALRDGNGSKFWLAQREVMEKYILKLTSNLLLGSETYPGSSEDALKELRGFTKFWTKLSQLIESKNNE